MRTQPFDDFLASTFTRTQRMTVVCDECGEHCSFSLQTVREELPDAPHYRTRQVWLSDCCGSDYHFVEAK